jgi:hypothetical protein
MIEEGIQKPRTTYQLSSHYNYDYDMILNPSSGRPEGIEMG